MRGTALIYSSHNRGELLHNDLIIQRALRGVDNKRILFLPMSETVQNGSEMERQEFSWGTFRWYFDFYKKYGLDYLPFYWNSGLRKEDVDLLWKYLWESEVVVLGGGHSRTGMQRYRDLGEHFNGDRETFSRILHERQQRGLLTVGYSAGADQLCEFVLSSAFRPMRDPRGFGLAHNVMTTLHHDKSANDDLLVMARHFPQCMVFGLPNDSGLYVDQGRLASGNNWQVIDFIIDNTWSIPQEVFHVKTRYGAKIEHMGANGRHWSFNGGDRMVRVWSQDGRFSEAWLIANGRVLHFGTGQLSRFEGTDHILASH